MSQKQRTASTSTRKAISATTNSPTQNSTGFTRPGNLTAGLLLKAGQYAKLVGISKPTAVTDLNELIKQGKIRKVGKFRGAYYELENIK